MNHRTHHQRASKVLPGGVNSSTRLNRAIGTPFYVARGRGSRVTGIDRRTYIDMCCAHGAGLLGNAHPAIDAAMRKAIDLGYVNAFETVHHEELASRIVATVACAEKVRFCSSGSEATLHLIRACRGYTRKNKIIRVEGHFHGYHEMIYIGGHPPPAAFPANRQSPYVESEGIPDQFADLIIPIPFNDQEALKEAIDQHGKETALLILEPINFNCGGIRADPDYLKLARKLTSEHNIVLFFDEIQSAYKHSFQAVQNELGVIPDVATIGKSIGGGLPLSAFCGRKEIMDGFAPLGKVQHSGTFNAHLVPVLAGLAFMKEAAKPYFYPRLRKLGDQLYAGIDQLIDDHGLNMIAPRFGARFNLIIGRRTPAMRYQDTFCHSPKTFLKILRDCFKQGVYFHDYGGGPAHHGFSIQHTPEDIAFVLEALKKALLANRRALA